MKIIKPYPAVYKDDLKYFDENSDLIKEIKEKYDYTSVVFDESMSDEEKANIIRQYDVLLTGWSSPHVPNCLAENPGNLKYICNITGEMRSWIDEEIVASPHFVVTNWGDAPAFSVAEGAFALMMTMMKSIPLHIKNAASGSMEPPASKQHMTLYNTPVGIYGLGVIGRKFLEMLRPFCPKVYVFDPYITDIPEDVTMVDSLEELCKISQIFVVHAALSPETEGSVTADHLAMLRDDTLIINTARGPIIDKDALEKEILSGRLRAGLDVFGKIENMSAPDSSIRQLDNVVQTCHSVGIADWGLDWDKMVVPMKNCLDNLERFAKGEELKFIMDVERYRRST